MYYNNEVIGNVLYSIIIAAFFSWIIIHSNIEVYNEQRNYEIRKKEYDLIVEKLFEVNKWVVLMWDSESTNLGKRYDTIKEEYYDFIKNVDTNCMIYFPERHILKTSLFNYLQEYRKKSSDEFSNEVKL